MSHRLVFSRGGTLLGALAILAAAGVAIPATAAAGTVTSLTACQPITVPGTYRLDADVTGAGSCFAIDANNVTLMLNGHTVTGTPASGFPLGISAIGTGDKILGPGTVTGWGDDGIDLFGSSSVRGVTVTGNFNGIEVQGAGNSVRGNTVTGNGGDGIYADGGTTGATIIGNTATGNGGVDLVDLSFECTSNVWRGNDFGTANQSCIH